MSKVFLYKMRQSYVYNFAVYADSVEEAERSMDQIECPDIREADEDEFEIEVYDEFEEDDPDYAEDVKIYDEFLTMGYERFTIVKE